MYDHESLLLILVYLVVMEYLFLQQIQVKDDPYYLMIISRSKNIGPIIEKTLPAFVKDLEASLQEFLSPFQNM